MDTDRQDLESTRKDGRKLQELLLRELHETSLQHEAYGRLLDGVLARLRDLPRIGDPAEQENVIALHMERLLGGHQGLAARIERTFQTLQEVSDDSSRLGDALERVCALSVTDELTGLPNRREFRRRLEEEIGRADRYDQALTLVMLDLDRFKAINDTYGHLLGDRVLASYSHEVFSSLRRHDTVTRYAGEAFAILLPGTGAEGARLALEKLKARARSFTVHHEELSIPLPRFSAGVAQYRGEETGDDLIERADAALYTAKRLGRDRIEYAPTTAETGSTPAPSL